VISLTITLSNCQCAVEYTSDLLRERTCSPIMPSLTNNKFMSCSSWSDL